MSLMRMLTLVLLWNVVLNGIILDTKSVNKTDFVLLVATSQTEVGALNYANRLPNEKIYIYRDLDKYTVRVVNIKSLSLAKKKLSEIRKIYADAMLWKKMGFLKDANSSDGNTTENQKIVATEEIPKQNTTPLENNTSSLKIQQQNQGEIVANQKDKMIFDESADSKIITQLNKDTKVYSAPTPYGKEKDEFKQGYFVKGVYDDTKQWLVIMQISTNRKTWFEIPAPLWMNINEQ